PHLAHLLQSSEDDPGVLHRDLAVANILVVACPEPVLEPFLTVYQLLPHFRARLVQFPIIEAVVILRECVGELFDILLLQSRNLLAPRHCPVCLDWDARHAFAPLADVGSPTHCNSWGKRVDIWAIPTSSFGPPGVPTSGCSCLISVQSDRTHPVRWLREDKASSGALRP